MNIDDIRRLYPELCRIVDAARGECERRDKVMLRLCHLHGKMVSMVDDIKAMIDDLKE
jgi:hypothetical protein